jgi:hypothetical protein
MSAGGWTPEEFARRFPTPDDYLAYHQAAGHICCGCVGLNPPLPCCNPGHEEAEQLRHEFDRIVREGEDPR